MFIKRPRADRKGYAIVGRDGKVVHDKRISILNRDMRLGLAVDEAEARIRAIFATLKPPQTQASSFNLSIVNRCHETKLKERPETIDPKSLYQGLVRGAEALGELSIREATDAQIRAKLGVYGPMKRHHLLRAINELLRYEGRASLRNPKPKHLKPIAYVRLEQFKQRVRGLPEEYQAYLGALFATGARWGELPVAEFRADGTCYIAGQIRKNGEWGETKNKDIRLTAVIPALAAFVEAYLALPTGKAAELRLEHYNRIYKYCKKILRVRPHDLRHSYAVELGASGASLAEVARAIGDTEQAARDHYLPFCATEDAVLRVLKRLQTA